MKSKKEKKKVKQENVEVKTQQQDPVQSRREFLNKLWKGLGIVASH